MEVTRKRERNQSMSIQKQQNTKEDRKRQTRKLPAGKTVIVNPPLLVMTSNANASGSPIKRQGAVE